MHETKARRQPKPGPELERIDPPGPAGEVTDEEFATTPIRARTGSRPADPDGRWNTQIVPTAPETYPFLHPPAKDDEMGRLGEYRIIRLLGRGGMALVFLAEDIALRRKVALKVLKPEMGNDPDMWRRFEREARLMASIKHENLVSVFHVAHEGQIIFLAMELLDGETVDEWLRRVGQAEPREAIRIGKEIAAGLDALHGQRLVHRDIKPNNLWIERPSGRIKILDLGLARPIDDKSHYTEAGLVVGTPAFMSPEQARGDTLDARSDLFSLGAVLYCLVTGHLPFDAPAMMGILAALIECKPQPIHEHNPNVPAALAQFIMQLLSKDPAARPASAAEVIERLEAIDKGPQDATPEMARPLAAKPAVQHAVKAQPARVLPVRAVAAPAPETPRPRKSGVRSIRKKTSRGRAWPLAVIGILAVVALVGLAGTAVALTLLLTGNNGPAAPAKEAPAKVYLKAQGPIDGSTWIDRPPPPPPGEPKGPPKVFTGVSVGGVPSPQGIFMHPPLKPAGGISRLSYRLDGQYTTFQADVSLNDGPPRAKTPLTFAVYGDGKLLWQSKPLVSQAEAQQCRISVQNVEVLTLQVDCPGDPRAAHAVWIEPHVSK
jgi:hypothetical protein